MFAFILWLLWITTGFTYHTTTAVVVTEDEFIILCNGTTGNDISFPHRPVPNLRGSSVTHFGAHCIADEAVAISPRLMFKTSLKSTPSEAMDKPRAFPNGDTALPVFKAATIESVSKKDNIAFKASYLTLTDSSESKLLADALSYIAKEELRHCLLLIAYDASFKGSSVLDAIILLPHLRKVTEVKSPLDFLPLFSKSSKCRGYIFLLKDPFPLLSLVDSEGVWDYSGKFIIAGLTLEDLNHIAVSGIGQKTEHIVGILQEDHDECKIYMNQLFWGNGSMVIVNRWRLQGFTSEAELFPDKTSDLMGTSLTFITFEFEPHIIDKTGDNRNGKEYYGRDIQIADALSTVLNFSLQIKEPPEGEYWGYKDDNGTWNGMTGVLARNEGHFGLSFFFLTNNDDMMDVLDYSRFYDSDTSCFMARTELPLPNWQSLAAPFKLDTWLAVLISLLAISPVLHLFARATSALPFHKLESRALMNLSESYLYSWGFYFRVSQPSLPRTTAAQIWMSFLSVYVIVLTTCYSSNLTAFLTVERARVSMETVRELYSSNLDVVTVGFFFKVSLEESGNVYLKGLARRYKGLSNYRESYNSLEKGEAVLLETRTYLEYLIATDFTLRGKKSMRILKECYAPYSIAIALQKDFPLKKSFDKVLGWLYDAGILRQWFLNLLRTTKESKSVTSDAASESSELEAGAGGDGSKSIALSIDHLQGIFYIHLAGLVLSTLLFLSEMSLCNGRCTLRRE